MHLDCTIDVFKPPGLAGGERVVREHAPRSCLPVCFCARLEHLLLWEQPIRRSFGGRIRQESDLGVAIEVDLLEEAIELEVVDCRFATSQVPVPTEPRHECPLPH